MVEKMKTLACKIKLMDVLMNEDAIKVIQEFEQINQNKKSSIVWLAYYQGQLF